MKQIKEGLFTPTSDRDTEMENDEVRSDIAQVILDDKLGSDIGKAEDMEDEKLQDLLATFGFSPLEENYVEKALDMIETMREQIGASDSDIVEALSVTMKVKLKEAHEIYFDLESLEVPKVQG